MKYYVICADKKEAQDSFRKTRKLIPMNLIVAASYYNSVIKTNLGLAKFGSMKSYERKYSDCDYEPIPLSVFNEEVLPEWVKPHM